MYAREGFGELGGNLLFLVIWRCRGLVKRLVLYHG